MHGHISTSMEVASERMVLHLINTSGGFNVDDIIYGFRVITLSILQ